MTEAIVYVELRDRRRIRTLELARFERCSFVAGHAVLVSSPVHDLIPELLPDRISSSFRVELPQLGIAMNGSVLARDHSEGYVFVHDGIERLYP